MKFHIGFLTAAQVTAMHSAGHVIVDTLASTAQHAEAQIIASDVGSKIAGLIHTVEDKSLSGAQKAAEVLAQALPLIVSFAKDGGVALVTSAENTARAVIQTIFNGTIGAAKAAASAAGA